MALRCSPSPRATSPPMSSTPPVSWRSTPGRWYWRATAPGGCGPAGLRRAAAGSRPGTARPQAAGSRQAGAREGRYDPTLAPPTRWGRAIAPTGDRRHGIAPTGDRRHGGRLRAATPGAVGRDASSLLAGIDKARKAPPPNPTEQWAIADGYKGIEHAQLVVVNVRDRGQRERAEELLSDLTRLRTDRQRRPGLAGYPYPDYRGGGGSFGRAGPWDSQCCRARQANPPERVQTLYSGPTVPGDTPVTSVKTVVSVPGQRGQRSNGRLPGRDRGACSMEVLLGLSRRRPSCGV